MSPLTRWLVFSNFLLAIIAIAGCNTHDGKIETKPETKAAVSIANHNDANSAEPKPAAVVPHPLDCGLSHQERDMSNISTKNLDAMPDVECLKRLMQSLALLDAIMSTDWGSRYYSFNSKWSDKSQMGSMRNGSGDSYFALFNEAGCFLKGFAHESSMSPYREEPAVIWPNLLTGVPQEFSSAVKEPAFSMDEITFCIWRRSADKSWSLGPVEFPAGIDDPDGSAYLLDILNGDPEQYCQYAEDYYEQTIPIESVRHIYDHHPLTDEIVKSLNPELSIKDLSEDLAEIEYPDK